ncbi:MAG: ATP-binding protein [Pseudomonadota bacterium]
MERNDLATLITSTATRVRSRDFVWTIAIGAGVVMAIILFSATFAPIPSYWLALIAFGSFLVSLAVRYQFSSGRVWAEPVRRAVETEIDASQAELSRLRLLRGVAQALPEPLFILDREGFITLANPAAAAFVAMPEVESRHFAATVRAPDVFEVVEDVAAGAPAQTADFSLPGSVPRSCRAFVAPLRDEENAGAADRILVYVRDLTNERRVEEMRADFIASASHELRTPLASLIGFLDTLQGHARDDAAAREKFINVMRAQAERMQRLVGDLTSLSRIELNEHVPPSDTIDVRLVAQEVIEATAPIAAQSDAMLTFDGADGDAPARVVGDRDEVLQAVQNLVDNALRYGGDPPMVTVRVGRGAAPALEGAGAASNRIGDDAAQLAARQSIALDDVVYVQVRDFGPGIERADLPRLTERFYRVSVERSRKRGGTGLGLAIVKHIATRHKGALYIESRLAGGTAFTLYFPARVETPAAVF